MNEQERNGLPHLPPTYWLSPDNEGKEKVRRNPSPSPGKKNPVIDPRPRVQVQDIQERNADNPQKTSGQKKFLLIN